MIIGCFFRELFTTIVFTIAFKFLRSYAGGYHAKTRMECSLLSYAAVTGVLLAAKYISINTFISVVIWMAAGVIILWLAPVEAKTKPLDETECIVYRKKVIQIWCAETAVVLFLALAGWQTMVTSVALAGMLLSISLIFGKIYNRI